MLSAFQPHDFQDDLDAIASIPAVQSILEVVCRTTGMGFAAVARVTDQRWVCCAVKDDIAFGLKPGGELKLETTICNEIRASRELVVIDHVAEDRVFHTHPTPAMYGFQSYISQPLFCGWRRHALRHRSASQHVEHPVCWACLCSPI